MRQPLASPSQNQSNRVSTAMTDAEGRSPFCVVVVVLAVEVVVVAVVVFDGKVVAVVAFPVTRCS